MSRVTEEQKNEYKKSLEYLYFRVNRSPEDSLADFLNGFSALTEFYEREEQTDISRMGIQIVLSLIETEDVYTAFLTIHVELLKVWIDLNAKYGKDPVFAGPYSFFSFIRQNPMQAIELVRAADEVYQVFGPRTHEVLQYILTMGAFVAADYYADTGGGKFVSFIIRRTRHFLAGLKDIRKCLMASGMQISWDHADNLVPTDGDMHCGGKTPYQIVYDQRKWVYKPHNLYTERLAAAALQYLSNLFRQREEAEGQCLRVLEIHLLVDQTGLMEFAVHAGAMEVAQAQMYFFRLGALLCFAKLLGIGDLHYDNIMATEDGPVIIDWECALDLHTIRRKTISNLSLEELKEAFNGKKYNHATFCVDGEIPDFADYRVQIADGFRAAAMCCGLNKGKLLRYFSELLYKYLPSNSFFYRVVPYKTEEFYEEMYNVIDNSNDPRIIERGLLDLLKIWILPSLHKICCIDSGIGMEAFLSLVDLKKLSDAIYNDLYMGDIPIFHLKYEFGAEHKVYQTGYVDKVPFFKQAICIGTVEKLVEMFAEQIDWIVSEEAFRELLDFIHN